MDGAELATLRSREGGPAGGFHADGTEFLLRRFGEHACQALAANQGAALRKFGQAFACLDEALRTWDGSPKRAARLGRCALFYRDALEEIERIVSRPAADLARAQRKRRRERAAFHLQARIDP